MPTSIFREARWLTRSRVQAYTSILLVMSAGFLAVSIDWTGATLPAAQDFAAFWTAAVLALRGHPADAYGEPARRAMVALVGPGPRPPFFYTPVALMVWLPFALLPVAAAAALWVAGTAAAFTLSLRALLRGPFGVAVLACPAVAVCALYGQNGLFSAALFAGVVLTLGPSPIVAGLLIGCLSYKPQLGLLAPLALLCARRYRAFAAAGVTVIGLAALSTALFGAGIWQDFAAILPAAQAWNAHGVPGFDRFASPYAAARLLGTSEAVGWVVQACFAVPAAAALACIASRRSGPGAETAMLVVATGFCVPFLGEYDLAILAVPAAWIAGAARRSSWLPYERVGLALLYLSPVAIKAAAFHGVPLAPAAMTLLAVLTIRRANETGDPAIENRPADSMLRAPSAT